MPMTLNVGLSKKVGEANYGSRGATVNLQTELDAGVVNDPDRLRERIRQMFHLARDAIHEELGANGASSFPNGNGHNGPPHGNGSPGRPATDSQVRALNAIARKQGFDLMNFVRERFGCSRPEDLSLSNASGLIDELNGSASGGRRR